MSIIELYHATLFILSQNDHLRVYFSQIADVFNMSVKFLLKSQNFTYKIIFYN